MRPKEFIPIRTIKTMTEPKFVRIESIGGTLSYYPLLSSFKLYRGNDANFMISISEDVGLLRNSDDYEIEENEYNRLIQFFDTLSGIMGTIETLD